ncbi:chaoptin-like [Sitodiplosis mosellana]|uniref:chaoptin-like n=1 Tax=Sitodiplosis mosellana TaxID=263140 RepID=UPI002443BC50|nr:chaoptin-like [Sitodiplosis mosellana]XP_055298766.1 chaoptin-like [Sitodiplosis mosellana]
MPHRTSQSTVWCCMLFFHLSNVLARNQSVIFVNISTVGYPLKLVYQTWVGPDLNVQGEWKRFDGTFNCREQDATDAIIIESSDPQMPAHFFDRYPGIESIKMTQKYLKSIASADFLNANSLLRLNVSHNEIDNIAPFAFDAAPKLASIDLSFNLLQNLNENIFTSYSIKYLYLHNNQLTVVQPQWFEKLLYLRVLTLNNNRIRAIDWQLFDSMPNINVLHLHANQIADVRSGAQQQPEPPRSMQTFSMYDNPVVAAHHLMRLNGVAAVDVRNTGVQICQLSQRMHTLIAANNEIREINLDNLSEPHENTLVTLHLANNRMESMANVTHFHRLQYLNLSYNLLAHIDAHIFDTLNNLQLLDLSHNKLMRFDVPNNRMPSLNALDVSFNEILRVELDGIVSQLETLNIDGNRIKATTYSMQAMKTGSNVNHKSECLSDSIGCPSGDEHSDEHKHHCTIRNYDEKRPKINDDIRDFIYEQFHIMEQNILQLIDAKFTDINRRIRRLDQEMIAITSGRPDYYWD